MKLNKKKKTYLEPERELRKSKDGVNHLRKEEVWFISIKLLTAFLADNAGTA